MKLSIHTDIIGKPDRHERPDKSVYYTINGKIINQGYGWQNVDVDSWRDAFELITTDGYATSSELSNDHRTEENYISRQICMVDIDDGMTIYQLLENEFYNDFGAGFYITKRHTDEAHRFRILFVLEEPEYDVKRMRKIIRGLLETFESADTNCKDASRIYYGIPNCTIKEYRDNILPKYATDVLVEMIEQKDTQEFKKEPFQQQYDEQYDEVFVNSLLARIANKVGTLHGAYDLWTSIAWATCHTVGVNNAKQLMSQHWPTKTKKELHAFDSWSLNKSPTIGTLIKLSGIDKDSLKQLELEFRARNNISIVLTPQQAIRQLTKKIRIY